jgi:hypothetical protein
MKGIYSYDIFIEKLKLIYNKHFQTIQYTTISSDYVPEIYIQKHQKRKTKEKPSITKTTEQIKEEIRQCKQKQRDEIKERLCHSKYKELRAVKLCNSISDV